MRNKRIVGDYVTLQRGITYKGNLVGKPGPALLGLGSIYPGGGFREGDYKTYGGKCPQKIMLHTGDLFVSLKGATKDGKMIGSIARVPKSVQLGRLTQDTVKLEFRNTDLEESNFLYWVLRTPQYRDYCASRATGSAVVALSRDDFLSYPVPILNTFRKNIVQLLEALENKTKLNRRMNATLEGMSQVLFKSWFVDFDPVIDNALVAGNMIPEEFAERTEIRRKALTDGTANREAAKQFPTAFELTEEMGWIPEGWEVKEFGSIARNIRTPADPKSLSEDTPYVGLEHIDRQIFSLTKWGYASDVDSQKSRFESSDFLFGKLRPYFHKVCQVQTEGICSTDILVIRPKKNAYSGFVGCQIFEPTFVEYADLRSTGTRMPRASWKDMAKYEIALPAPRLIETFNKLIQPSRQKCKRIVDESLILTNLRDTLLPKLISGELRIPEAEKIAEEALA